MSHDVDTLLHTEGGYSRGYFASCSCGFAGPLRELHRRGQALIDGYDHVREMREATA